MFTGPMYSRKSERLITQLGLHSRAQDSMLVIRHSSDNRYHPTNIVSHDNKQFTAFNASNTREIEAFIKKTGRIQVLAIDEIQFFKNSRRLVSICLDQKDRGVSVYLAGLDTDFLKRPFRTTADIMAVADLIDKATPVCEVCKNINARWTQRLINNQPASRKSGLIVVGSTEGEITYQARCNDHHIIPD